jgi:hypothetical protein
MNTEDKNTTKPQIAITKPKVVNETPPPVKPEDWFQRQQRLTSGKVSNYAGIELVRTKG